MSDYLLRWRSLSTEDLLIKKAALEAQDSIYISQGIGTKSMQRDLRLLNDQLNAIYYVLRERQPVTINQGPNQFIGVTDFSGLNDRDTRTSGAERL